MRVLQDAHSAVKMLLGEGTVKDGLFRKYRFCTAWSDGSAFVLFHVLTREVLLLSREEHDLWESFSGDGRLLCGNDVSNEACDDALAEEKQKVLEQLVKNHFLVPVTTRDRELADQVRQTLRIMEPRKAPITKYTVLTTTDCNARCFYCYEIGTLRYAMTP